jgi:hypothetical protein
MSREIVTAKVMTLSANERREANPSNQNSDLIMRNPAPDSSPSREPNGSFRELVMARTHD